MNEIITSIVNFFSKLTVSDWICILGIIVGVIGIIVGIIGKKSLVAAQNIKAKEINNSTINNAETLIVQNGVDTYAVIKIAKDVTQEELKGITENLAATTLDISKLKSVLDSMPRIYTGTEEPKNLKNGDLYFQCE